VSRLNYRHLHYFWAVAHEGNLTRAAARLHVSQSALSIQVQKLEEQLGHALFERRGRALVLTEAGRIALDHADVIFAAGDDLLATLQKSADRDRQVLRVGALSTLSRNFQLDFLRPVLARSDVEVIVQSGGFGELLARLGAHELDCVLANSLPPRDEDNPWIPHRIAEQVVTLVGTPARIGRDQTLRSLLETEPVVLPSVETGIRTGFDSIVDRLGIRLQIAAEVDDMAMLRLLAREDIGLAVLPPIVVKDELAAGTLVAAEQFPQLSESFYAITLSRRFPNPLLQPLIGEPVRLGEAPPPL